MPQPLSPEKLESIRPMAVMNLHVGFISFASFCFYANCVHQTRGDCSVEEGRGNYVWVVLLFN